MPRKRKLSNEEDEEEPEEVENGVRAKRRAAVAARDLVAKEGASDEEEEDDEDFDDEDDEKDEHFEGEGGAGDEEGDEEGEKEDESDEDNDEPDVEGDEDDDDDEVDEEDLDTEPIDCILAELEEPTADTPGYVLKKKDSPKKLEMCFMGEMRETLVDISEAFSTHFEDKKLPVLHVTKFDTIGEVKDTTQIDILEVKYDKAYDIRETDEENDDILSQNFYSLVKVDGIEGVWATQYFLQED